MSKRLVPRSIHALSNEKENWKKFRGMRGRCRKMRFDDKLIYGEEDESDDEEESGDDDDEWN